MTITFGLLSLAICAVWLAPLQITNQISIPLWPLPFAGAVIAGLATGILDWLALAWLGVFCAAAFATALSKARRSRQILFGAVTMLLALALALHMLPGFHHPLLIANMQFSVDAVPFTQYANFDKAAIGLILLALLVRRCGNIAEWRRTLQRTAPIVLVTAATVIAIAIAAGHIRPDPKLSWYTPVFLATNLLFVCVAEETFFRGVLQEQLSRSLSDTGYDEPIAVMYFGIAYQKYFAACTQSRIP